MTQKQELKERQQKQVEEYDSKVRSLFDTMEGESDEQKQTTMYRKARMWVMKVNRIIRTLYPQEYMAKVCEIQT